jgi:hypothetical protein
VIVWTKGDAYIVGTREVPFTWEGEWR